MAERLLIRFDVGLAGAALRVALGAAVALALRLGSGPPALWPSVLLLLLALFGLKAVSAVARRLLPATDEVRAHWDWRRDLARQHDSYQWRKMIWIGAGVVLGAALGGPGGVALWRLGVACALSGAAAEVVWRRKGLPLAPPRKA